MSGSTPTYTDTDSTRVGGEVSGWAYLNQYTSIPAAEQAGKTLYSYFKADSVTVWLLIVQIFRSQNWLLLMLMQMLLREMI
ncbi:MAG: hypothetical protein V8T12_00990 [Parabacteroides johnsonii]